MQAVSITVRAVPYYVSRGQFYTYTIRRGPITVPALQGFTTIAQAKITAVRHSEQIGIRERP